MLKKYRYFFSFSVVALILIITPFLGNMLDRSEPIKKSIYCVPLSGSLSRDLFSVTLYQNDQCEKILVLGGHEGKDTSKAAARKIQLLIEGIPEQDILMNETDIYSTYDELTLIKQVLYDEAESYGEVMLISDRYHTRRLSIISDWITPLARPRIIAIPDDENALGATWWRSRTTRNYVMSENIKYVYYYLAYKFDIPWLSSWLRSLSKINDN